MLGFLPLTDSVILQPVLSINACNRPCGTDVAWMRGKVIVRRLTVVLVPVGKGGK
jgi:hypothetical protein